MWCFTALYCLLDKSLLPKALLASPLYCSKAISPIKTQEVSIMKSYARL